MDNEKIVNSIKELCKKHGITANYLETEIGASQGLISRWLKTTPSLDKLIDIADYFDVSLDNVIGRNNSTNNNELFVKQIYTLTQNNELEWEGYALIEHADYLKLREYSEGYNMEYQELYIANYQTGKIIILMQYDMDYGRVEEYKIDLFLQPDNESEIFPEECDETQLYKLWQYIYTSKYGELDETKIDNFKEKIMNKNTKKSEQLYEEISNFDFEKIQQIQKILTPEFQDAINIINSEAFKSLLVNNVKKDKEQ